MGHGEEHAQQLAEADTPRVVTDLHRFGVIGHAAADAAVVCSIGRAAGITRGHRDYAVQRLEYRLHAPEAARGQHEGRLVAGGRDVLDRIGHVLRRNLETGTADIAKHGRPPSLKCDVTG